MDDDCGGVAGCVCGILRVGFAGRARRRRSNDRAGDSTATAGSGGEALIVFLRNIAMTMSTTDTSRARRQINLPEDLCAIAERQFIPQFENLESLLEFVLRELTQDKAESLDQTEQALLEQRLKDLGYI